MIAQRTAVLKAALAILIFGTVPAAVSKIGLNTPALGIVRLTLATAGMSLILASRPSRRVVIRNDFRRAWPALTAMGAFFGLHWLTYFIAIKLGSPSMSELGFSTYGAQLPLLGWAFGFGRPRAATVAGIVLAIAGSAMCLWGVPLGSAPAGGLAVGVVSGTLYAALPILHQRFAAVDAQLRTWAQFAFALPLFLALAPAAEWAWSVRDVLLALHLSLLVTLVGHYLWVQATTVLPIPTTSMLAYTQLPVSLTMNYFLINKPLTIGMAIGAACIVAANGLALGLSRGMKAVAPAE